MKTVVNFFSAVGFVMLTGLMVVSGNSLASTPDGQTPANEGVCDPLKADGISKGLYGLCVAYCEAQDLDEFGDKDPPKGKILSNYNNKMQPGDPTMPCIKAPCPCWSSDEFNTIVSGMAGILACDIRDNGFAEITVRDPNANLRLLQRLRGDLSAVPETCRYLERTGPPESRVFNVNDVITRDQIDSCHTDVVTFCNAP